MIRDLDDTLARDAITEHLDGPFRQLVFSEWDAAFLTTPEGQLAMQTALVDRYLASRRHGVPWLGRVLDLPSTRIVEIGCGTGASTVAMAERCESVVALDVDAPSVKAAEARSAAHELDNIEFHLCEPTEILATALTVGQPDAYVLYAVLEHLTVVERLDALRRLWAQISPGGRDRDHRDPEPPHLPRSAQLGDRLHAPAPRRAGVSSSVTCHHGSLTAMSSGGLRLPPIRTTPTSVGSASVLGASYHEFVAAIDEPLEEIVVADGYEDEILSWFGLYLDELVLLQYMLAESIDVPSAFARSVLNVVLRKPASDADRERSSGTETGLVGTELSALATRWRRSAGATFREPSGSVPGLAPSARLRRAFSGGVRELDVRLRRRRGSTLAGARLE